MKKSIVVPGAKRIIKNETVITPKKEGMYKKRVRAIWLLRVIL
jgi:hypothetical protein